MIFSAAHIFGPGAFAPLITSLMCCWLIPVFVDKASWLPAASHMSFNVLLTAPLVILPPLSGCDLHHMFVIFSQGLKDINFVGKQKKCRRVLPQRLPLFSRYSGVI
jgi:hypothetical protein